MMNSKTFKRLRLTSIAVLFFPFFVHSDTLSVAVSTLDHTGIITSSSSFTNALSMDVEMPYGGDIFIVANYNAQITEGNRTKATWRLESNGQSSSINERYLSNIADLGISSLVFLGTNPEAGTLTINLQHKTDNKPLFTNHATLLAIPLTTSSGIPLPHGFFNSTSTSTVSSTSFEDTSATTSVSVVLSGSSVLISSSVNCAAPDGAETGEWKLQYKKQEDILWVDASLPTKRAMSGTDDVGSIVLHALAENLELGPYDVRLVARSEGGSGINSFNINLAVINLAYSNGLEGESFPTFTAKSLGGSTSSAIPVAVPNSSISFTPPAEGNLISLASFSGIPIGDKRQLADYEIALINESSTQTNQHISRYFSDTADWGSGGCAALFTNLNTSSYTLEVRHSTASSSIGTSNLTLVGISTTSSILDSDFDGMPNAYENYYFGDPTNALVSDDLDGDEIDNLEEYICNCDPTDSNSVFTCSLTMSNTYDNPSIEWPTTPNRIYEVYWTSNLLDGFISTSTPSNITYPTNTFTDLTHSEGFYRIGVGLP